MPKGYCSVPGCLKYEGNEARPVYSLPNVRVNRNTRHEQEKSSLKPNAKVQLQRRAKWLQVLGNISVSEENDFVVCSRHFVSGKPARVSDVDALDWVPTLFLPDAKDCEDGTSDRHTHIQQHSAEVENLEASLLQAPQNEVIHSSACGESAVDPLGDTEKCKQSLQEKELLLARCKDLEKQLDDYKRMYKSLEEEHAVVLEKLKEGQTIIDQLQISEQTFVGKDAKVQFMTGLPNHEVLMCLYNHIEPHIKASRQSSLSKFQQYILVLMRLRLDMDFKLLALYFNVCLNTVSRVFYRVIHVLYVRLDFLITWPSRENLHNSMPLIFRETFGHKVAVIIDCFEVRMERPSNILAAAQVYSHYKSGNTVKFLIGISPSGAIVFISDGFGGRSSDKMITERSEVLDNLIPGDLVLADKGFTIHEIVREKHAQISMPAFRKGVKQLSPEAVEESREISNLRIHVERVIGVLKSKFLVWSSTLPIEFFHAEDDGPPVIDKMMRVCCALINANASVVPLF